MNKEEWDYWCHMSPDEFYRGYGGELIDIEIEECEKKYGKSGWRYNE